MPRPRRQNLKVKKKPAVERVAIDERAIGIYRRHVLDGVKQATIAAELDLHPSRISQIVRAVEDWMVATFQDDVRRVKVRHDMQLEDVRTRAMARFVDTQEPHWLYVAIKAMSDQRKVWGADEPAKQHLNLSGDCTVRFKPLEEMKAEVLERIRRLRSPSPN